MPRPLRLTLFFTRGISLEIWEQAGILGRELALYQALTRMGVDVRFITYGGRHDLQLARLFPEVRVCCNTWGLRQTVYERLIPWLHRRVLADCDVIKTNQVCGGRFAVAASRRYRKPLVARCDFLWSEFARQEQPPAPQEIKQADEEEQQLFTAAERIIVATEAIRSNLIRRFPGTAGRFHVIGNLVDTHCFYPADLPPTYDLLFVGRLVPQKNLRTLLEAIRPLDCTLSIVGDGPLRNALEADFADLSHRIAWHGKIEHGRLPGYFQDAKIFVAPSLYEGHPKAVLEAMACGLPVLAADAPGLRDWLQHGQHAWLVPPQVEPLRVNVQRLLNDTTLRKQLGTTGRQAIEDRFSLAVVAERELAVLREAAVNGSGVPGGRS